MTQVGALVLPVAAGTRDTALSDPFTDGLLDYVAHLINRVSAAADKIIPRDEDNPSLDAFVMVPTEDGHRNTHDPLEERSLHTPFIAPSLWLWWDGNSRTVARTAAYRVVERTFRMLYVFVEEPSDLGLRFRANLWALIDAELHAGSDDQWQADYSYGGYPLGTSLTAAVVGKGDQLSHDFLDWEYMGGRGPVRVGAYAAEQQLGGDSAAAVDYPAFVGAFVAHEKIARAGSGMELEDSTFAMRGPGGVPIMSGVVQHPDGSEQ